MDVNIYEQKVEEISTELAKYCLENKVLITPETIAKKFLRFEGKSNEDVQKRIAEDIYARMVLKATGELGNGVLNEITDATIDAAVNE